MITRLKKLLGGSREPVWGRTYKGLPIRSDHRVHDAAFRMIEERLGADKKVKALDIATGSGAFARRLADRFPGWDLSINDFESQAQVTGFQRRAVDLNTDFASSFGENGFDLVVAIEILEHLENPWLFLRETRKLLRPGGVLVLSTPNVDSTLDRLVYLVDGHPLYFGERGYVNSGGHITPVPDWLFRKIAQAAGFSSVRLDGSVDTSPHRGPLTPLKLMLMMPFSRFYMRNRNDRSINVYLCE